MVSLAETGVRSRAHTPADFAESPHSEIIFEAARAMVP